MLWQCPIINCFWAEVCNSVSVFINVKIIPCPAICLLGHRAVQLKTKEQRKIAGLAFLVAKRIILTNWKTHKPKSFSLEEWVSEFLNLLGMERAADILNDTGIRSGVIWNQVRRCLLSSQRLF